MKKILFGIIILLLPFNLFADQEITWPSQTEIERIRLYWFDESMAIGLDPNDSEQRKNLWSKNLPATSIGYSLETDLNLEFNKKYHFFITTVRQGDLVESLASNRIEFTRVPKTIAELYPENPKPPIQVITPAGTTIQIIEVD